MAFTQIVCVADSEAEAERDYAEAVSYFYTHNKIAPRYFNAPGYQSQAALRYQQAINDGDTQIAAALSQLATASNLPATEP